MLMTVIETWTLDHVVMVSTLRNVGQNVVQVDMSIQLCKTADGVVVVPTTGLLPSIL